MKKHFTLLVFSALMATSTLIAQSYKPVNVSGYNYDVIAESKPAANSTNLALDASDHVIYSKAYVAPTTTLGGLVNSGTYTVTGRTYQLAAYTQSNVLKVDPTMVDSLVLVTPKAYSAFSLLGFATGIGDAATDVTLKFSDGSSTTYTSIAFYHWISSQASVVSGFGRTNRTTDVINHNGSDPKLYAVDVALACTDAEKLVTKILISNTSAGTSAHVLAVSGVDALTYAITTKSVSCAGGATGSATVVANGGKLPYAYSWNSTPSQTTAIASTLTAGDYTITVTDANSCMVAATLTITEPLALISSVSSTSLTCGTTANGSATVSVSGGVNPYTYTWTSVPTQTTSEVSNLGSGNYTVSVSDANKCLIKQTVTIAGPTASIATTTLACGTGTNGSATVTSVNGGAGGPYTYSWSSVPSQTTATATGLKLGNYVVTIKDVANCSIIATASIVGPTVIISTTSLTCNGIPNGSATMTVNGGTAPYTYSWSSVPSQTMATATGLAAGTYTGMAIDANNCLIAQRTVISQPSVITSVVTVTAPVCNGLSNGTVRAVASGGVPPYNYSWSTNPVQTNSVVTGVAVGIYTVTVTDNFNCVHTKTVSAYIAPLNLNIYATPSKTVCANTTVTLTANGAVSYTWSNGATANTTTVVSTVPTGTVTYGFNGKSLNGCNVTGSVVILTSTVACITGFEELENTDLLIYPNPNNGIVIVKMRYAYKNASIEITDALGKLVAKQSLHETETIINTANVESGIYSYVVKDNSSGAILARRKMIKQ